ncbi:hypothetical protein A2U01_0076467, partial [Trifolium medium]|nr:hypothetical protein [Trifolium medium]
RWASQVSLGEHHVRRFLAPAIKFQFAVQACSLGKEELAGRGRARWASTC